MQKLGKVSKAGETATARNRGRPRAFDREAALAQATRLFWSKGYEATSIADLTEAMGIGSPSLYAAFGSKQALYVEALRHYRNTYDPLGLNKLQSELPAREAIEDYLMGVAAGLSAAPTGQPTGCMVTLASVSRDEHPELNELMRSERAVTLDRLEERLKRAVAEGEIPASVDVPALARFVLTILSGMSILARDGASRAELEDVVQLAMLGWNARIGDA